MRRVLLALLLLAPASALAKAEPPVAVMEFRNLNKASDLEWLTAGIPETMISDLRKNGMKVVERGRIDEALAEMALQGRVGADASTAAKLGKLVGAKTVVVGGFQKAGSRIRITARFVTVETGVVQDTAKTTGKLTRIFDLQDQIVAKLIGKKPRKRVAASSSKRTTPRANKPRKKASEKQRLEAYKIYARSLQTSSKATRLQLLREAIEIDPDFVYALDDLDRLERKLRKLEKEDLVIRDARIARQLEQFRDPALAPDKRGQLAMQILTNAQSGFRYRSLLAVTDVLQETDLPMEMGYFDLNEYVAYYRFLAHMMLKDTDAALQHGEQYLEQYKGGQFFSSVDMQMQSLIEARRDRAKKREQWPAKKAEIDSNLAERIADAKENPRLEEYLPLHRRVHKQVGCAQAFSHAVFEESLKLCGRCIESLDGTTDKDEREVLGQCKYTYLNALTELGRFDEARKRADQWFGGKDNGQNGNWGRTVRSIRGTWPRD